MDNQNMDLSALKPNDPPRYSADDIVLPEQPEEPDVFDEETGTAEEIEADFDAEETNVKGGAPE